MKLLNNILSIYKYVILILATMLIILFILILYLEVCQLFNMIEVINKETLEIANESIKSIDLNYENTSNKCTNKCVFGLFSHLFERSDNSFKYYPSNFVKYDYPYKYNNIYLPENVIEYLNSVEILREDFNCFSSRLFFYFKILSSLKIWEY